MRMRSGANGMIAPITSALVILCLLALPALAGGELMTVSGKAENVDVENSRLTMTTDKGESMTFEVNDSTRIVRDGHAVGLSDISAGDKLTVNYEKSGDTNLALAIGVKEAKA